MYCSEEIRSFSQKEEHQYREELAYKVKSVIESANKEYILNVDETEYIEYLENKYKLFPLEIDKDSEHVSEPVIEKEQRENRHWGGTSIVEVYNFKVSYSYSGSKELFSISPSSKTLTSYNICLESNDTVSFVIQLTQLEENSFNRAKNDAYSSAFTNAGNINKFVATWNNALSTLIQNYFKVIKDKYIKENSFFAAINVKTNKETSDVFTVPTIKAIETPKPKTTEKKAYTPEPTMSNTMYDDILKIIHSIGQSMERKPSLYVGKDEEALRDQFLLFLETRYEGVSATGETFNKHGKTDILLKHQEDGTNLFIAELKVWHGAKQLLEAISQLFDRYLTWRDSKVAVMMFVKNKDFTQTIETVKSEISNHPYYLENLGQREDTSLSYKFHLAEDNSKEVLLEVMMFHFPEDSK